MPKTDFDYYYGVEAEQFTFVRVPKVLLLIRNTLAAYPRKIQCQIRALGTAHLRRMWGALPSSYLDGEGLQGNQVAVCE